MNRILHRSRRRTVLAAAAALLVSASVGVLGVVGATTTSAQAAGRPSSPTDATKVPHYFGPWPNWANSPFTTSTAQVEIVDSGIGQGASAVAQVDPVSGAVSGIDVTSPGHDYDPATTTVRVTGGSTDAAGTVTVATGGAVVELTITDPGSGYSDLKAEVTGGGGTGAVVTPSGGVDAVHLADGGSGYTMPTVDFDLPDDPDGTIAKAHVPPDGLTPEGVVTTVVLDDPGSGYSHAPNVVVRNGTLGDPINGATEATASTTLKLVGMSIANPGADYTSAPDVAITDPTGTGSGALVTARTDLGAIRSISLTDPGAGFLTKGMKKFQDELPSLRPRQRRERVPPRRDDDGTRHRGLVEVPAVGGARGEGVQRRAGRRVRHRPGPVPDEVLLGPACDARARLRPALDPGGPWSGDPALQRAARRHPRADPRATPGSRPPSGWARSSRPRRTGRCGSSSATSCPTERRVTSSCRRTAPAWAPAWGRWPCPTPSTSPA